MPSNNGLFPAFQQALLLTALATAIALGSYASSDGPDLTEPVRSSDSAQVRSITITEAKALLQSGTAMFMDVRDIMDYMDSHLPGAGSLPRDIERQQDTPMTIIIYCSDTSCGKASTMADLMLKTD